MDETTTDRIQARGRSSMIVALCQRPCSGAISCLGWMFHPLPSRCFLVGGMESWDVHMFHGASSDLLFLCLQVLWNLGSRKTGKTLVTVGKGPLLPWEGQPWCKSTVRTTRRMFALLFFSFEPVCRFHGTCFQPVTVT